MKVAAVQFCPTFGDPKSNIQTMAELLYEAVQAGSELVVFPELATTGYSFMSRSEARLFAEDVSAHRGSVGLFRDLSQKLNVGIVWGLVTKDPETGDLYNSQAMALPNGTLTTYAKLNRWGQDLIWAKEGSSSPPVTDYLGAKVGLLICRDVRDKSTEFKNFYEKGDADIVAFSTNWGDGGFPSLNWVEFAQNNKTWLVVANRYGQEANNDFGEGGSCIITPKGEVHCEGLKWSAPCVVYAETS